MGVGAAQLLGTETSAGRGLLAVLVLAQCAVQHHAKPLPSRPQSYPSQVREGEPFPADAVLLASSSAGGIAYVETSNLDGETNLKLKQAPPETAGLGDEVGRGVACGAVGVQGSGRACGGAGRRPGRRAVA